MRSRFDDFYEAFSKDDKDRIKESEKGTVATQEDHKMKSRVIYEIDKIKYTENNGGLKVHIDNLQRKQIEFIIDVLNKLKFPYKRELTKSEEYENAYVYRFIADDRVGGKEYSSDDIYSLEDVLCIGLKQNKLPTL